MNNGVGLWSPESGPKILPKSIKRPFFAINLLTKVIFVIFSLKYLVGLRGGCNFASLFGSQDVQDCVSDFFDAFSGRWREIIEMFAMRKIDSAETRKGNPVSTSRFRKDR